MKYETVLYGNAIMFDDGTTEPAWEVTTTHKPGGDFNTVAWCLTEADADRICAALNKEGDQ